MKYSGCPSFPEQKITVTHNAVDYMFDKKTLGVDVVLRENAVASCQFTANDYLSETFIGKCDIGDHVKVEFRYKEWPGHTASSWTQRFGGWITRLQPSLLEGTGEIVGVTALGYGVALIDMLVRQQYGTQSANSTLNTIKEALTDSTYGIIPKYVNKVMASATNSGHSINTTKVADLTSDFRYLYFPGKPAIKALHDMCDLIRAANTPNAGAHWIVVPDGTTAYLCLATVGAHENPPADVWPTWWNTDQAGSTIEVKKDMIVAALDKKRSEANYVLYVGNFRRPANMDNWTEQSASSWGTDGTIQVQDDNTTYKIDSYSIDVYGTVGQTGTAFYPSSEDLNLDITKIGTPKILPRIHFYARRNSNVPGPGVSPVYLIIGTGAVASANSYYHDIVSGLPNVDEWRHFSYPIGEYYDMDEKLEWGWTSSGSPDWADIDWIGFNYASQGSTAHLNIDGLYIEGLVTRAAYDSALYTTQKCKMMFLRDDVPKDDSLVASDDSGQMAQFAKAELYRAVTEPVIGTITIPMQEQILPGQLAHIHFAKKSNGAFRINRDMRILTVRHKSAPPPHGFKTYLTLSSDVLNSYATPPTDQYNNMIKAMAPGFQHRARASLIVKDLDLTQPILAKSYST